MTRQTEKKIPVYILMFYLISELVEKLMLLQANQEHQLLEPARSLDGRRGRTMNSVAMLVQFKHSCYFHNSMNAISLNRKMD